MEAVTMRAVAREAGVSHAAPAHHFADLEELLDAVAIDGFQALADRVAEAQSACGDDPWVRLRAYGLAYIRHAQSNPAQFRIMFRRGQASSSALSERIKHEAGETAMDALVGCLKDCASHIDRGAGFSERRALLAWSLVHGCAVLLIDGPITMVADRYGLAEQSDVEELVVETFLETLRADVVGPR